MCNAFWLALIGAAISLAPPMAAEDAKTLDPEERLLAALNCGIDHVPAGWKAIAQWTIPGRWPRTTSLRAYHAASFGSGRVNVDYMVCHLGWYGSTDFARAAYREALSFVGPGGDESRTIGEEARLSLGHGKIPAVGDNPQQNAYQLTFRSGPLLFEVNIVTVEKWSRERLEAFGRTLDEGVRTHRLELAVTNVHPRLLKDKLKDPMRAPNCDRKCSVHDKKFSAVLVPTGGGLRFDMPATEAEQKAKRQYWDARLTLFPNAAPSFIDVGCIHDPLHEEDWTCACAACTTAESAWRSEHNFPKAWP